MSNEGENPHHSCQDEVDHDSHNSASLPSESFQLSYSDHALQSSEVKAKDGLRKGKWTPEEEKYTNKVIEVFNSGLLKLPDHERGITLRAYLAEKLGCDPMRITKKYTGAACLGKKVYHFDYLNANHEEAEKARAELQVLENNFRVKLEQMSRRRQQDPGQQLEQHKVVSTPAIDALMRGSRGPGLSSAHHTVGEKGAPFNVIRGHPYYPALSNYPPHPLFPFPFPPNYPPYPHSAPYPQAPPSLAKAEEDSDSSSGRAPLPYLPHGYYPLPPPPFYHSAVPDNSSASSLPFPHKHPLYPSASAPPIVLPSLPVRNSRVESFSFSPDLYHPQQKQAEKGGEDQETEEEGEEEKGEFYTTTTLLKNNPLNALPVAFVDDSALGGKRKTAQEAEEEQALSKQIRISERDHSVAASSLLGFISHLQQIGSQEDLVEFFEGVQRIASSSNLASLNVSNHSKSSPTHSSKASSSGPSASKISSNPSLKLSSAELCAM